ncbi:replication initiation negative regulator SeqA [Psychrobium sp. 1_MG-2023]|uniref:replication initiation negative regulator SeqA n=1 Tax=Psychrobium sp. 1_MG-2023 TaxID=3062624 RepID=UPI000C32E496|nr:replication initiation negative regulator SeqA [Psychrobium sp. 1_MG-2023]MDP2562485.1 replication initiation negative regulator SeqA [Psychrobium sp. 1_MG-2023]PKF54320.1 replication initiation negative regulator SeqA [Alteromonadales bacterium alter-6D02]
MKSIEVEDDLYRYIASQTEDIGESASAILRRLLGLPAIGEIPVVQPIKSPAQVREQVLTNSESEPASAVTSKADVKSTAATKPNSTSARLGFNQLIASDQVAKQKAAVGRFLYLLSSLHQLDPAQFERVLQISGRDRLYFAKDKESLLGKNGTTKPKQIGATEFWVITNSNTGKKRSMLTAALVKLGCEKALAQEIAQQI